MRRLMVLCLLALLPLQFSWAAIASHCEGGAPTEHFRHAGHGVVAEAGADHTSLPSGTTPDAADVGCDHAHCHGHCHCLGLPALATALPSPACVERHATCAGDLAGTPAAARPERPQWQRLA